MEASNQETVKCKSVSEHACTEFSNQRENGVCRQPANEEQVNVCEVIEALQPLEHEYYKFGIYAGLQPSDLELIKLNHSGSTFECLSTVAEKVMNKKHHSWDELADIVEKMGEFKQIEATLRQRAKSLDGNQTERSKSGQTDPSCDADTEPDSSKMTFECGCGNCTIHDYTEHKACPKPTKEFPFLDVQGVSYEAEMVKFSLHKQTQEIRKAFAEFREDTFKSLIRNGCMYRDVQCYVQRLVYPENPEYPRLRNKPHMEDCNSIKNASDYDQLENALCDNYCSWFNYDILKELRCKFIIKNPGKDESLQKYEEKLSTYCRHRCFESPKRFHPEPLNEEMKTLVFKVEETFHEFTLNQVRHITGTVRSIINCPKYALYIKSVQEGCVEVTCNMLQQFAEIDSLSKDQVSELEDANIVSLKINDEELIPKNDEFIFHFKLPADGLALSSVAIVDGVPELYFRSSPKVPTITEQDVAAVIRLASEQKRPEFFYISIPMGHPFSGRQFKQYSPTWLRGTSIGELLSEANWKMKCLHMGVQSNETKSIFWSWQNQSCLDGLATRLDFPQNRPPHSISMSCQSVTVKKSANELEFPEEPKMKIVDDSSSLYSKYITEIYQSVAYYDEPLFLKVQELIKLILSAEWLIEKGVRINKNWLMNCTTKPMQTPNEETESDVESGYNSDKAEEPPSTMLPQQKANIWQPSNNVTAITRDHLTTTDFNLQAVKRKPSMKSIRPHSTLIKQPTRNAAIKVIEAEYQQSLFKHGRRQRYAYGWFDHSSQKLTLFDEDDICLQLSQKVVATKQVDTTSNTTIDRKDFPSDTEFLTASMTQRIQSTTTMASVGEYDMLYRSMDPNQAIPSTILGKNEIIIPNVQSWSELYHETVPKSYTWQSLFSGVPLRDPIPSVGISTRQIPVREEAMKPRRTVSQTETMWKGTYKRHNQELAVAGQAVYRVLISDSEEFSRIASKFTSAWQKGVPPRVQQILAVSNRRLEAKWRVYRQGLHDQTIEEHFHGTKLSCNITSSQAPCSDSNCGVCGISCSGLDRSCIRKNIAFQRFGHGFYLAPHSSKCHDYTEGAYSYRAMLLCHVCPGNKYRLEANGSYLSGPPRGYDSVYGQVGSKLNYPEIVVYESDAVIPRFIILYQKDGEAHLLAPKLWSELYHETVIPSVGISTHQIPVREEAVKPRRTMSQTENMWKGTYKRYGRELAVAGQAVYRVLICSSEEFSRTAGKFTSAWQKGVPPAIHQVFAVSNESQERKWRAYRQALRDQTIEEHFHGTKLSCNITTSQAPCRDGNCGVCGISCSGLDRKCIRKNIDFQRFGHGFYLAPHSSKCHDYTEGAYSYRAMLLCDVCPGNKYRLETNGPHLSGPPRGYDSVYGQVGSKLNYPEIVVYEPDAVIPRFIILYQKDGVAHPLAPRAS